MSSAIAKLFSFCYRRAWLAWLLILLFTAGMAWCAFRDLHTDVSAEGLLPQDTPLRARYEEIKKTFGSDHVAAVYIQDPNLFSVDKLNRLADLSDKLAQLQINIPLGYVPGAKTLATHPEYVKLKVFLNGTIALPGDKSDLPASFKYFHQVDPIERAESLLNISTIHGDNGMVASGPMFDPMPETADDLAAVKAVALHNPLLVGTLVSKDGTATLLTLYLKPTAVNLDGFDQAFASAVDGLIADQSSHFFKIFQIGPPVMHVTLSGYMMADQLRIFPLSCIILVLLIAVMMHSVPGAIAPLLNATFSNIWTLGVMALIGMPINMLNYVVPALMVIIGATSDVHLMIEFRNQRARGLSPADAITETGRKLGLSIFLTNFTTVLGFASTGLTDVTVLRQFGITAALAMAIRYFATLVALPPYLRLTERWFRPPLIRPAGEGVPALAHNTWWDRYLTQPYIHFTMERLVPRLRTVITLCIVACIPLVILASHIQLNNDFSAFLHADSPLIRQLNTVARHLSGTDVIDIAFRGEPGEYKNPVRLKQIFEFEQYLRRFPEIGSVLGLPDFIALVNREFHDGDPKLFVIPDNPSLLHQYLILFHPSDLKPYATANFSEINLVLRCDLSDSARINALVDNFTKTLQSGQYGPQLFTITGHAVLSAALVDSIALGQVLSLGSMAVIMLALIGLVFLSWRAGALSVVANIFPIVAVFGLMGACGIPLNLGTCMIAGISMGIAMDDTVHLMVRYHQDLRRLKEEKLALVQTLEEEFQPVVLSSIALAGGFLVLATSSFVPIQQFGALSALVMVLAVAAELLLTPTFLCSTRLITVWDVIDMTLRRALREKSAAFEGLTSWQLKKLLAASNIENHPAGELVIRSGDEGTRMYIVIEGELEVTKGHAEHLVVLNRLGPGQVIGEVALVARVLRSADVTAITPVKLLTLDWHSLRSLQRFSPYLAAQFNLNLARILGLRLADTLGKVETRHPFGNTRPSFPVPDPNSPSSPS